MNRSERWLCLTQLLWLAAIGCGPAETASAPIPSVGPPASAYQRTPDTLAGWNLFTDSAAQRPGPRTQPYDVIAPLFADYAQKQRFVYVPEGEQISYDPEALWQLPTGSILIKTFSYFRDESDPALGQRLLETRLIVFAASGVQTHTYVFSDDQTSTTRKIAGATLEVHWQDVAGNARENAYRVPNTNQCLECHGKRPNTHALGLRTRQLDRDFAYDSGVENQLDHLQRLQLLDPEPEPYAERERLVDPFGDAPVSERARAYLDSNCSQCHMPGGDAAVSGMWIDWKHTGPDEPPARWGVCKHPTSASGANCGHEVDIAPGDPERSIYMCRMQSTDPKVQMPPLGRNFVHDEAVTLLREWIAGLPGSCD